MPMVGFSCPKKSKEFGANVVSTDHCLTECKERCMSLPLLMAIIGEPKAYVKDRFSVTEILDPPQIVWLKRNVPYVASPYSYVFAVLGSGVHTLLEDHAEAHEFRAENSRFEIEKKFEVIVGDGITLVGKVDLYDKQENVLWDYKTMKTYAVERMKSGHWNESKNQAQLNMYHAFFYPRAERLMIEAIIKDWSVDSKFNPVEDIEVPKLDIETTHGLTRGLLTVHVMCQNGVATPRPCVDEERWINQNPRSRNYMVPLRCRDFCAVSSVCPQYKGEQDEAREGRNTE